MLRNPSLWTGCVLFIVMSAALVYAAPQTASSQTSDSQTVTGCLQKGLEDAGLFLISADGKHWELYPSTDVSLADHVGHTVTLTGSVVKRTAEQEEKSQPYEKKEITGKHHSDLQVSAVKSVGQACTK